MKTKHYSVLGFFLALLLLSAGAGLSGCSCDTDVVNATGQIATNLPGGENPSLLFINVEVNKTSKSKFKLFNKGDAELTINSMTIVKDPNKVFKLSGLPTFPLSLAPGEANGKDITVEMLTKEAGIFEAQIRIESSDATNVKSDGYYYVKLRNQELRPDPAFECKSVGKAPRNTLNFGQVKRGETKSLECVLTNRGSAVLEVKGFRYKNDKGANKPYDEKTPKDKIKNDFRWETPREFPFKLQPNSKDKISLKLTYAPSDFPPAEDQGAFELITNIIGETEKTRYKFTVVGITLVPAVQLIPIYPDCSKDQDCTRIDNRLACQKDDLSGKSLCQSKPGIPPLLKFPLTSQGKSTKRRFLIRSIGALPLKITQLSLGTGSADFKVTPPGLPFSLDPKQEKEIEVVYAPSSDKSGKNTLYVESNAGSKPKAPLTLEASAFGCDLQAKPASLKYTGPQSKRVTLFNQGNQNCNISEVVIKGGAGSRFTLTPAQIKNQVIAPNGRFDFIAKFAPTDKSLQKDAIVVKSNDPDEPTLEIPLEGKVSGNRECELSATPANLNFRLVAVGSSRKLRVAITNKGWGTCVLSSLNILNLTPGGGVNAFTLTSKITTPTNIDSGNTLRLEVNFAPPQESGYTGKIVIASNDRQQPNFEVQLTGTSGTFCLELVPNNMDFGSVKFGCATPVRKIEVYNIGAAKCTANIQITKLQCAPGNCFPIDPKAEFRINSAPSLPVAVGRGQKIDIGMSYKAKDLGVDTSSLELYNNIPGQSPMVIPLIGEGVSTDQQRDVFKQLSRPLTDIMFVIDNSCSMGDEQASLAKNFQSFINWAVRLNVDYHIMVVTTDVDGRRHPPGCAQGTVKVITPSTPNPTATFSANARLGTSGSGIEKGLEGAFKALTPPVNNSANCNRGFYRKAASLSMIFVSDEEDSSPNPLPFYSSFFKNLKGYRNLDLTRASAIVGPPPSGCRNPGSGSASAGNRYWQVAKELRGARESICNSNWATTLSNIGSITFGYRTQFFLSRQADPKTLRVKVNGTPVKEDPQDGWQYEASTNSINFSSSQTPPPSATIQIDYKAICLP